MSLRRTPPARPTRWLLPAVPVFMAIALLAAVFSTYRGVKAASDTLIRGQADVLIERIRFALSGVDPMSDRAELDVMLDTLRGDLEPEGLRTLVLLPRPEDTGSTIRVDVPGLGPVPVRDLWMRLSSGRPVSYGDRVYLGHSGSRARVGPSRVPARFRARPLRTPPFIVAFEPSMANDLIRVATRTLGIGAVAGVCFLGLAGVLVMRALRQQAQTAAREHERRLAALGQMSAVLAHEIRNPLASLKGNAQLLARGLPAGEKTRDKAERVVDEAVRLESLSNDLLDFARKGVARLQPTDPAALLREAAAAVGIDGITVRSQDAPATWALDGDRMRRVLINLLDNAVQAQADHPGGVVASVTSDGGQLVFTVQDEGNGIAPDDLPHVFEPFHTRKAHGTGLGLAVARHLVQLHGGSMTVANGPQRGAVFEVRLPQPKGD